MGIILKFRNKIESLYDKHSGIFGYVLKLIFSFAAFILFRANTGYNTFLSNFLVILAFSVACAFTPVRIIVLVLLAYLFFQISSLSIGVGVVAAALMLIMYLLYFRLDDKFGYAYMLVPMTYMLRIPALIPLVLAVTSPLSALSSVICGNVLYFMVHYVNINSAVFTGLAEADELTRMTIAVNGLFTYREFLYNIVIIVIVYLTAFFVKKINVNRSNDIAVFTGAGIYLILRMLSLLISQNITASRLVTAVVGTVVSLVIAILVENLIMPLDFSRTEFLEFEDDEYHYYVRAVPKASLHKESVKVKKISRRKEGGTL